MQRSLSLDSLLTQFKAHMRLTTSDRDTALKLTLEAAVLHAENFIGEDFFTSTYEEESSFFEEIDLPEGIVNPRFSEFTYYLYEEPVVVGEASDIILADGKLRLSDGLIASINGADPDHEGYCILKLTGGSDKAQKANVRKAILLKAASIELHPEDGVEALPTASVHLLRPERIWR